MTLTSERRTRVVTAALLRLVAPRPWLLAIDDIDRIDSASSAVLGELCAAVAGEQVIIVSSAAPGAGAIPHQANALVIELGRSLMGRATEPRRHLPQKISVPELTTRLANTAIRCSR